MVIPTADYDETVKRISTAKYGTNAIQNPVTILHTESREEALKPEFITPLKTATGVWFTGGRQTRLVDVYLDTPVEKALQDVVRRGGVVGGMSAGAAVATKVMIVRGEERRGFDLLPVAIVDQHFIRRNREERLRRILALHPDHVGFGIDEATALIVQGRKMSVLGESSVTVMMAPGGGRPERKEVLTAKDHADLIALNRAAIARQQPAFPPPEPPAPIVKSGSLVIVGGGQAPDGLLDKFIEMAGGPTSPIVYIPCEETEVILKRS